LSELARVLAYAYRQRGKASMARNELKQLLSFGLNWYEPRQASLLLDRAVEAGLLRAEGDQLALTFDAAAVELPIHFRGGEAALTDPLPSGPPSAAAPADAALVERVRALQALSRGRLSQEAARLLALRERGLDVRAEAAQALAAMVRAGAGTA
jgi:hypothetical protein